MQEDHDDLISKADYSNTTTVSIPHCSECTFHNYCKYISNRNIEVIHPNMVGKKVTVKNRDSKKHLITVFYNYGSYDYEKTCCELFFNTNHNPVGEKIEERYTKTLENIQRLVERKNRNDLKK